MKEKRSFFWAKISIYRKRVWLDTIHYITIEEGKTTIYFTNDCKPLEIDQSLTDLESVLPCDRFFRCNRSCIVNIDSIDKFSEKIPELVLTDGKRFPIVRDRVQKFCKLLMPNAGLS